MWKYIEQQIYEIWVVHKDRVVIVSKRKYINCCKTTWKNIEQNIACQNILMMWNIFAFSNIPMQWKRKHPTCLSNPKIWKIKRLSLETEALPPSTVLVQSWLKRNGESDYVGFVMLSDFRILSGVKFASRKTTWWFTNNPLIKGILIFVTVTWTEWQSGEGSFSWEQQSRRKEKEIQRENLCTAVLVFLWWEMLMFLIHIVVFMCRHKSRASLKYHIWHVYYDSRGWINIKEYCTEALVLEYVHIYGHQ